MRLHTALHLLGAVVKAPVTGGRIGDDKAHLDFDIEMEKLVKDGDRSAPPRVDFIFARNQDRLGSPTPSSTRGPSW